ncbi:MAG TPA: DinB family protein [Anaerolineales bacterium]|nr:DinB family protein [Anaerolineales bacterium]
MKELREYREKLIQRLEDRAKAFRDACLAVQDPYISLPESGWNVHQLAVHTRDVDRLVYGMRARRTAMEQNPEFSNFDGNAYMAENYDASESLRDVLNSFVSNVENLVELLRGLPEEAWSRVSRHATLGSEFTLQSWVEKDLAHINEHLETVKSQNKT